MSTPPRIRCCSTPLSSVLTIMRCTILVFAFTTLVLDIISINESVRHSRLFIRFVPQLHLPDRAYIPFVLTPDIMAIALFTILLWTRMRLPDRLHNVHTMCRVLSSAVLVCLTLFCPAAEAQLAGEEHSWERYWCQNMRSRRNRGSSTTFADASVRGGSGSGTSSIGSNSTSPRETRFLAWQSARHQSCVVMRTRAILAFVWAALVFLELALSFWSGEFKPKRRRRRGLGAYGAQGTLDMMSNPSTSHVWSEDSRDEDKEEEVFVEEFGQLPELEVDGQSHVSIAASSFLSDVDGDRNGEGSTSLR